MDATPDPASGRFSPPPPPRPSGFNAFLDSVCDSIRSTGLVRTDDRWVGGVSGGLARKLGIDVALTRGILLVLGLLGGLGMALYGIAWALLPEERDGRIHVQEAFRGNVDGAIIGAVTLVVLGIARDGATWPALWQPWGRHSLGLGELLGLLVTIGVVILIIRAIRSRSGSRTGPVSLPPTGPAYPAAPYATAEGRPTPDSSAAQPGAAGSSPDTPGTPPPPYPYPPAPPTGTYPAHGQPYSAGPSYAGSPSYAAGPAPYHAATAYAWAPPTRPTAPPKRVVRGPGATSLGVVVALAMLVTAGLLVADRQGGLAASPWEVAAGSFVVLLGLGIVVAGLRGRSSGVLGFLAILAILATIPFIALGAGSWTDVSGPREGIGTQLHLPTDRAVAAEGYALGAGESTVDLSSVPMTSSTLTVPIRIGAGNLTVVVPPDATVRADVHLLAGEIDWNVDHAHDTISGTSLDRTFVSQSLGSGTPELVLDIRAGTAQITIEEG